jgi:hypothetical protein
MEAATKRTEIEMGLQEFKEFIDDIDNKVEHH